VDDGYAAKMPDFARDPESENAREHQRAIVRRYAREALYAVEKYGPITFAFHWGLRRVEAHVITCPAELVAYVLRGPTAFHRLGGAISRAGPDVAPAARPRCPTCGAAGTESAAT
jgi:hypothetical protein